MEILSKDNDVRSIFVNSEFHTNKSDPELKLLKASAVSRKQSKHDSIPSSIRYLTLYTQRSSRGHNRSCLRLQNQHSRCGQASWHGVGESRGIGELHCMELSQSLNLCAFASASTIRLPICS